jgi:hypothetical protein
MYILAQYYSDFLIKSLDLAKIMPDSVIYDTKYAAQITYKKRTSSCSKTVTGMLQTTFI